MGGKQDDLTGRLKEAVGDVADESLEREGQNDRAAGAAKGKLDDATPSPTARPRHSGSGLIATT